MRRLAALFTTVADNGIIFNMSLEIFDSVPGRENMCAVIQIELSAGGEKKAWNVME